MALGHPPAHPGSNTLLLSRLRGNRNNMFMWVGLTRSVDKDRPRHHDWDFFIFLLKQGLDGIKSRFAVGGVKDSFDQK